MALTESGKIYTERGAENDKQLEKRNENEASSWLYTVGISQHSKGAGSLNAARGDEIMLGEQLGELLPSSGRLQ
uniref:Uncharacterized protein n=1 Tax=Pristionchus pacificus TaxID=54126 RepID=A0A2A6BIN6_PRIPA|eukprot:PDM65713.1 hypothetical protein PRIPAC_45627 [Pristionchus pacificus]